MVDTQSYTVIVLAFRARGLLVWVSPVQDFIPQPGDSPGMYVQRRYTTPWYLNGKMHLHGAECAEAFGVHGAESAFCFICTNDSELCHEALYEHDCHAVLVNVLARVCQGTVKHADNTGNIVYVKNSFNGRSAKWWALVHMAQSRSDAQAWRMAEASSA